MRSLPKFRMGLVTDGNNEPLEDPAVAYADRDGIEYVLELRGEDAFDILTEMVKAASAHRDLVTALGDVLPMAKAWAEGKSQSHPDHEWVRTAEAVLEKAEDI